MKEKEHSRTGLLLMEIILAVLFFSVSAVGCLRIFVGASRQGLRAKQLKAAVNSTENFLQQLKAVGGERERLREFYPDAEGLEDGVLYFDENGAVCTLEEMDYSMRFLVVKREVTAEAEAVCYNGKQEEIYRISTLLAVERDME